MSAGGEVVEIIREERKGKGGRKEKRAHFIYLKSRVPEREIDFPSTFPHRPPQLQLVSMKPAAKSLEGLPHRCSELSTQAILHCVPGCMS